jgi:TonB family protein
MVVFRYVLLISLGLLPAAVWAQSAASQPAGHPAPLPVRPAAHYRQLLDSTPGAREPRTPADSAAHRQPAAYPGGDVQLEQALQRKVRYPAAALRAAAEGRVFVSFAIEADGTVGEVRIVKSPSPLLNDEVVQAVKTLSGFAPAQQDGQPVRSTVTFPVTFRIVGAPAGRPAPPRGPVQPQAAPRQGNQVVSKLVSFQDSTYRLGKEQEVAVYRHYFTYDHSGRPATHTQGYRSSKQGLSWQVFRYTYGPEGRLATKISERFKYVLHYGPTGQLSGITGYSRAQQQWVVYQETTLTEKDRQPDGSRLVALVMNNVPTRTPDSEVAIDYLLAADNTVIQSTSYRLGRGAQPLAQPLQSTFAYDTQRNPLADLLPERWYQFEVGQSGAHNQTHALSNGKEWKAVTYTYNEAGLPTQGISRRLAQQQPFQTQTFAYADVVVSTPHPTEAASGVAIYPNPAATSTVIKAVGVGPGPATLRLRWAATGEVRRQSEHRVATTFQETVSVAELEKGTYIVEILQGPAVVTGRLLVE